jgi:phosphate transport system protein
MNHTEKELQLLKNNLSEMWHLVTSQLEKSRDAFIKSDIDAANEVVRKEKRVDAFELKIDADCENYIALFAPVAIDLRLVLSIIKIGSTLERIGDFAYSIACHTLDGVRKKLDNTLLKEIKILEMFEQVIEMLSNCYKAFENEDVSLWGKIISQDDYIDEIYRNSPGILEKYIQKKPDLASEALRLMIILRKLERIGDHCNNIIEELVFYVDAKVLKHSIDKHR